jgi:hypothetical protein
VRSGCGRVALAESGSAVDSWCLVGGFSITLVESRVLLISSCDDRRVDRRHTKDPGMVKPQLTVMSEPVKCLITRSLTNIVDMLAVSRGIRSIDTCSQAEVVWRR